MWLEVERMDRMVRSDDALPAPLSPLWAGGEFIGCPGSALGHAATTVMMTRSAITTTRAMQRNEMMRLVPLRELDAGMIQCVTRREVKEPCHRLGESQG